MAGRVVGILFCILSLDTAWAIGPSSVFVLKSAQSANRSTPDVTPAQRYYLRWSSPIAHWNLHQYGVTPKVMSKFNDDGGSFGSGMYTFHPSSNLDMQYMDTMLNIIEVAPEFVGTHDEFIRIVAQNEYAVFNRADRILSAQSANKNPELIEKFYDENNQNPNFASFLPIKRQRELLNSFLSERSIERILSYPASNVLFIEGYGGRIRISLNVLSPKEWSLMQFALSMEVGPMRVKLLQALRFKIAKNEDVGMFIENPLQKLDLPTTKELLSQFAGREDYLKIAYSDDPAGELKKLYGAAAVDQWLSTMKEIYQGYSHLTVDLKFLRQLHKSFMKGHVFKGFEGRRLLERLRSGEIDRTEFRTLVESLGKPNAILPSGLSTENHLGFFRTHHLDRFTHEGSSVDASGQRYFTVEEFYGLLSNPYFTLSGNVSFVRADHLGEPGKYYAKAKFYFPGPEKISGLVEDAFEKFSEAEKSKSADWIFNITELVWKLLSIHPFLDGNGRTIRALVDIECLKHGVKPPKKLIDTDFSLRLNEYTERVFKAILDANGGAFFEGEKVILKPSAPVPCIDAIRAFTPCYSLGTQCPL